MLKYNIDDEYKGQRLDAVLAQIMPEYSRSRLSKFLKSEAILINRKPQKPRFVVQGGETIEVLSVEPEQSHLPWQAEEIKLDVVHQDSDILIINKPANLVVHPGAGNWHGTLVNGLLNFDPRLQALPRAGIVHRLDKDTSGLLVIARNLKAHKHLVQQLEARTVKRQYFAILHGVLTAGGTINAPIGRHKTKRTKMAVLNNGKLAITHYRIFERFRAHTAVTINLETGRTHQIRVHMANKKIPLVGDKVYGGRPRIPPKCGESFKDAIHDFPRQVLHAVKLGLSHPKNHQLIEFKAKLPNDIADLVAIMRKDKLDHE